MVQLTLDDTVYGKSTINDPIIIDLINSQTLDRMKRVGQFFVPQNVHGFPWFSRYEHCVGVMLLLKKFGASLDEQIAGLLHDVSHTSFSHVGDWVFGNKENENYQDSIHREFILNSDAGEILKNYNFNPEKISDLENFKLLENKIPNLCADRFDYAIREIHYWADPKAIPSIMSGLTVNNGSLMFNNKDAALRFAVNFLKLQREHWSSVEQIIRFDVLSQALKRALNIGIITKEDMFTDDEKVMVKLESANDYIIDKMLKIVNGELNYVEDHANPEYSARKKFRYVDPEYIKGNKVFKLSETDASYRKLLELRRRENQRGISVRLIEH